MKFGIMKPTIQLPLLCMILFGMAACSNTPQLFWELEEPGSSKSSVYGAKATAQTPARVALELPPELRADIELPMANEVASNSAPMPAKYRKAVAGKAVALDTRVYDVAADQVFSAVVDAMTSLNMPIESVDSPSGIVTTDWVKKGAHNSSMLSGLMGKSGDITRHRFVVRVFRVATGRADSEQQPNKSRLEVRTLLQKFAGRHWVNSTLHQRHAEAFFSTVEEQLGRITGDATTP